jgi:hypothetical protein
LRQVLHSGPFADFLIERTDKPNPIQVILDLDGPDDRLVDAELLLRLISFRRYHSSYSGNLNAFLEDSMGDISSNWDKLKDEISAETDNIFAYIEYLYSLVPGKVGRKFVAGKWLTRFNKSIFEVEVLSLMASGDLPLGIDPGAFQKALEDLFSGNAAFLRSVEATTKSLENYQVRFGAFQEMLASVVGKEFKFIPGKP